MEEAYNALLKEMKNSEAEELIPEKLVALSLPDTCANTCVNALLTVTASKLMGPQVAADVLFELVGPNKAAEEAGDVRALRTLHDACVSKATSMVDALEETKAELGAEGIAKEYAVLCQHAAMKLQAGT